MKCSWAMVAVIVAAANLQFCEGGKDVSQEKVLAELDRKMLVCIKAGAPWCPPCKKCAPAMAAAEEKHKSGPNADKYELVSINVDKSPKVAKMMKIRGIPSWKCLLDGKIVCTHKGGRSTEDILEFAETCYKKMTEKGYKPPSAGADKKDEKHDEKKDEKKDDKSHEHEKKDEKKDEKKEERKNDKSHEHDKKDEKKEKKR